MATTKSRILGLSAGEINGSKKRTLPAVQSQQVTNAVNRVETQPVTRGTTSQVAKSSMSIPANSYNGVPAIQGGQVNGGVITKLVTDALNKRIQAANMGMQAPIRDALTATTEYYNPKSQYKNMGATGLDTLAQLQQGGQNRTNVRAQGLMNLYSAFGDQANRDLNSMEGIYSQQNQAKQLEAQQKMQEEVMKLQQQQQAWNQQYQGGQLSLQQQQAQNALGESQWQKDYQAQILAQNQAAQDWQQKYQQGLLDTKTETVAENPYDKLYITALSNQPPPNEFGAIDPQWQEQMDQLKSLTSFAAAARPMQAATSTDEYWADGKRKVKRNAPQTSPIPGIPVANAAGIDSGAAGMRDQNLYGQIMSVPDGTNSPAGWIKASLNAGIRDPQEITDFILGGEDPHVTDEQYKLTQSYITRLYGGLYKPNGAEKTPEQLAGLAYSGEKTNIVLSTIDDSLRGINEFTTGAAGRAMALIPGTDAYVLDENLKTIKANILANELAAMKQASATGASGLGALSDREGALLQAAMGSLDIGLPAQKLKENLAVIKGSISRWRDAIQQVQGQQEDQYSMYRSKLQPGEILVMRNGLIGGVSQNELLPNDKQL